MEFNQAEWICSQEATNFIKQMVDESFMLPIDQAPCHVNHKTKVTYHHLSPDGCGAGNLKCWQIKWPVGAGKTMRNDPRSFFKDGENKSWSVVDTNERMYIVLRVKDENTDDIIHYDKIIPKFLHQELSKTSKQLDIFIKRPTLYLIKPDFKKAREKKKVFFM
tara:strand:+ start:503 stop:991 length:489 start_codon:yes stop_codon:yes gene_type:complete